MLAPLGRESINGLAQLVLFGIESVAIEQEGLLAAALTALRDAPERAAELCALAARLCDGEEQDDAQHNAGHATHYIYLVKLALVAIAI